MTETPLTEGEMERIASGMREIADTQEKALPKAFMAGRAAQAQRIRAMVDMLRLGARSIEQLIGSQIDLGLKPVRITLASHASATVHVHPIVAEELERLRKIEGDYYVTDDEIGDALAQQKLEDQP